MTQFINGLWCGVVVLTLFVGSTSQAQPNLGDQQEQRTLFEAMALTSKAFRAAVEKIRPSLVTIESFGGVSAVQGRIGGIRKQGEGNTTGVFVSTDGHIITSSFNFITSPPVITVITADGERRVAKMLGKDETRKICLLKVSPFPNIVVPEIAELDKVAIGQWAISVGVGYGDVNPAVSTGIISAKNRIGGRAVQTDANISPANYGGPLLDIEGSLIGICVPMHPHSQAIGAGVEWYDSGIGFAIPLSNAGELIERLKSGEQIYAAFLGVEIEPNPEGNGVLVTRVLPDSAASKAGIGHRDIIKKINDQRISNLMELRRLLSPLEAGSEITIEFESNLEEKTKTVTVVLGRRKPPDNEPPPMEPPKIR